MIKIKLRNESVQISVDVLCPTPFLISKVSKYGTIYQSAKEHVTISYPRYENLGEISVYRQCNRTPYQSALG